MTPLQKRIHDEAHKRGQHYKRAEWPLIEILQRVLQENVFRSAGHPSLFANANKELGLSESLSHAFSNVAVKAIKISQLANALRAQKFSVTKIIRVTSVMTPENADELIALATRATNSRLDRKSAELKPGKSRRPSKKPINQNETRLSFDVSNETLELFARAKDLQSKKEKTSEDQILSRLLNDWLDRNDPVRKAERAKKKKKKKQSEDVCAREAENSEAKPKSPIQRTPLTAEQKHAVNRRDRGQCTATHENGERCEHKKWIDIHHIVPVSAGGSNDPWNLRTLCWFHHDLIHQLRLPMEGQFNRIREASVEYRVGRSNFTTPRGHRVERQGPLRRRRREGARVDFRERECLR